MKIKQYNQLKKLEDYIYKNKEYNYLKPFLTRFEFIKTNLLLVK